MQTDAELEETTEARMQALKNARRNVAVLAGISIVAGVPPILLRESLNRDLFRLMDLVLIAIPWIVAGMLARWPMLYSPMGEKNDPRPSPMIALFPSMALWMSPIENLQVGNYTNLLLFALLPAVVLAALVRPALKEIKNSNAVLLLFFAMFCVYGYGLGRQIDTSLDRSLSHGYSTQVLEKTTSQSRGRTNHFLYLSPWKGDSSRVRVEVTGVLWRSIKAGNTICITEHGGALHAPWYTVQPCQ
jgi:hypothetical protein